MVSRFGGRRWTGAGGFTPRRVFGSCSRMSLGPLFHLFRRELVRCREQVFVVVSVPSSSRFDETNGPNHKMWLAQTEKHIWWHFSIGAEDMLCLALATSMR